MLSLLTPEYQQRMVQGIFHESVTNAPQWSASFCYPEGLLRFYTQFAVQQPLEVMMNPNQVQFLGGIADNFLFRVLSRAQTRSAGTRSGTARRLDSGMRIS
jgi:hypothetical protein